jgi:hypothetical protein
MKIKMFHVLALGFSLLTIGCATTGHGDRYTDAEVEMAMRSTENETLARMAASTSSDIADAASMLAHQHAAR